jgi:hypothetical protein
MSLPPAESDLLRQMVRQVLQEIVPRAMAAAPETGGAVVEAVTIGSDGDLQAFARRVATSTDAERAAIAAGETTFHLVGAAMPIEPSTTAPPTANVVRIESGAVTERHVREAAGAGSSIRLGRKAVLTPLARDRARAAGVEITKER